MAGVKVASGADARKVLLRHASKVHRVSDGLGGRDVSGRPLRDAAGGQLSGAQHDNAAVKVQAAKSSDVLEKMQGITNRKVARKWTTLKRERGGFKKIEVKHALAYKRRRADLPFVAAGAMRRGVDDHAMDKVAIQDLETGVYTRSALKSSSARIEWWRVRAAKRGLTPFPLDQQKLTLAGALLKRGGYRSAKQYLYSLKKQHTCEGGAWEPGLASWFKDVKRSCERGLGGSKQADALPLGRAAAGHEYTGLHLVNATEALLVGVWWMLREVELANITKQDTAFVEGVGCGVAALHISASKTDAKARGIWRRHGCACPSRLCPVKALKKLVASAGKQMECVPLVTTKKGYTPTKAQTVEEIAAWSRHLEAPAGRYTGHSLRTTGAQRLAMAGVSEAKIRMFGRWASDAMIAYVRETLLAASGMAVAKEVVRSEQEQHSTAVVAQAAAVSRKWHRLLSGPQ